MLVAMETEVNFYAYSQNFSILLKDYEMVIIKKTKQNKKKRKKE